MKLLPLYPNTPLAAVEDVTALRVNHGCQRCDLSLIPDNICLTAEGDPGGLLFVGDSPGADDDKHKMPFRSRAGLRVRSLAKKYWNGPAAYTHATRCYSGGVLPTAHHIEACRGYLAHTIREVEPDRIIAMGPRAIMSLFNRSVPIMSVRRGYGYLENDGDPIPVLFLNSPVQAQRNRFIGKWMEADIRWACKTAPPPLPPWEQMAKIIETPEDALEAEDALRDAEWFAFDTETIGVMFDDDFQVVSIAATPANAEYAYVWDADAIRNPDLIGPLAEVLADPAVGKVGHNLKYDAHAVRCELGILVMNWFADTMLWRKMLAADVDGRLDIMSELVGMGGMKGEAQQALKKAVQMINKSRLAVRKKSLMLPGIDPILEAATKKPHESPKKYAYGLLPRDVLHRYNALDTITTARLATRLEGQMKKEKSLNRMWGGVVQGACVAIEQMEAWGIAASRENVEVFDRMLEMTQRELSMRFEQYEDLNPDSTASISNLLFGKLGLPSVKLTPGGSQSTDKEALTAIRDEHPLVEDLIEWRRVSKLRGTYATGMMQHIRSDGRIHPSFRIDGARTGRMSCAEPNLQNIRRPEDPESKMARDIFVAPPGFKLVEFDYSQLELRVATILSGDPKMKAIWDEGVDYHLKTAQMISRIAWGIDPSEITDAHRTQAKTVNFAVLYGMTAVGMSRRLGLSIRECEKVMDAIMGEFKVFAAWCDEQIALARRTGYVYTWWDGEQARRRPLWGIASKDDKERSNAENGAKNTPVQGTASEFCLASLAEAVNWIEDEQVPAKLVLTVHDSLMFEVRDDAVEDTMRAVPEIMKQWNSAGIPLGVDMKVGQAWGSLEKV